MIIPSLLEKIGELFSVPQERLFYVLLGRGRRDALTTKREVALICDGKEPLCVAKWFENTSAQSPLNRYAINEFEQLGRLINLGLSVPRPLQCFELAGTSVTLESYVLGETLAEIANKKSLPREKIIEHITTAWDELFSRTATPSTESAFHEELRNTISPLIAELESRSRYPAVISYLEEMAERLSQSISKYVPYTTSLVHNGFALSNLIVNDGRVTVVDWKFAKRSHFAFAEVIHPFIEPAAHELKKFFRAPSGMEPLLAHEVLRSDVESLAQVCSFLPQLDVLPREQRGESAIQFAQRFLVRLETSLTHSPSWKFHTWSEPLATSALPIDKQLERTRNELGWYARKFRELLLTHSEVLAREKEFRAVQIELEGAWFELKQMGVRYDTLQADYDRLKSHIATLESQLGSLRNENHRLANDVGLLRRFDPNDLPKLLRFPVKALITGFRAGPLEPMKMLAQKRRAKLSLIDTSPQIEVVTLAYNSERFLRGYFEAFTRVDYPLDRIRLNIIDNGSKDRSHALIQELFVENPNYPVTVELTRSEKNLGFSGGNNYLLRRLLKSSPARFFLLLNIDTEIDPNCLRELVETMRQDPLSGMVEARQAPKEHPKWYDPTTFETGWCSGGGVLIARKALETVGLFDHRFFLYCEDVDLSWRMWLKGWKCKINLNAIYNHYTEALDKERDRSVQRFYSVRNSFFMHYKWDTWEGIRRHKQYFDSVVAKQSDQASKDLLLRAYRESRKFIPSLLVSRARLALYPRIPWVMFDGFNYERRREFFDTEDGRRVIVS